MEDVNEVSRLLFELATNLLRKIVVQLNRYKPIMTVTVCPLEENEISEFVRIELEAFRSHPRIAMLWRRGYTEDVYAFYEANKRESFQDPSCHLMKAMDDETGKILAVSEWMFAPDPTRHAHKDTVDPNGEPPANWPADGNWEMRRFFNLNSEKWTSEYLTGRPYIST